MNKIRTKIYKRLNKGIYNLRVYKINRNNLNNSKIINRNRNRN
jgi:hypothetical protein